MLLKSFSLLKHFQTFSDLLLKDLPGVLFCTCRVEIKDDHAALGNWSEKSFDLGKLPILILKKSQVNKKVFKISLFIITKKLNTKIDKLQKRNYHNYHNLD